MLPADSLLVTLALIAQSVSPLTTNPENLERSMKKSYHLPFPASMIAIFMLTASPTLSLTHSGWSAMVRETSYILLVLQLEADSITLVITMLMSLAIFVLSVLLLAGRSVIVAGALH